MITDFIKMARVYTSERHLLDVTFNAAFGDLWNVLCIWNVLQQEDFVISCSKIVLIKGFACCLVMKIRTPVAFGSHNLDLLIQIRISGLKCPVACGCLDGTSCFKTSINFSAMTGPFQMEAAYDIGTNATHTIVDVLCAVYRLDGSCHL